MTTMRYITVACDVCSTEESHWPTAGEAREWSRKNGWTRRLLDGRMADLCPRCSDLPTSELIWWDAR